MLAFVFTVSHGLLAMQIRITDPKIEKDIERLAKVDKRSSAKEVEALLLEAIAAREARTRQQLSTIGR